MLSLHAPKSTASCYATYQSLLAQARPFDALIALVIIIIIIIINTAVQSLYSAVMLTLCTDDPYKRCMSLYKHQKN